MLDKLLTEGGQGHVRDLDLAPVNVNLIGERMEKKFWKTLLLGMIFGLTPGILLVAWLKPGTQMPAIVQPDPEPEMVLNGKARMRQAEEAVQQLQQRTWILESRLRETGLAPP